jgi:YidC/Oxa1 family membrane protein insertase
MAATSWYQQRQMQKAAPPGAAQQQQKAMQFLPLIFVFLFIRYPVGLTLYWTTTNIWQIGQQHFLLSALKKDQEAAKAGLSTKKATKASDKPAKPARKGFMARAVEEAEKERTRKATETKGEAPAKGSGGAGQKKPGQNKSGGQRGKPQLGGNGQSGGQPKQSNPKKKKSGPGSGGNVSGD